MQLLLNHLQLAQHFEPIFSLPQWEPVPAWSFISFTLLTHPEANIRSKAVDFIESIIDFAGPLGTPAIIGSMQGRHGGDVSREQALNWLSAGLNELGAHAGGHDLISAALRAALNRYSRRICSIASARRRTCAR